MPTITFVGGSTEDLYFHIFDEDDDIPLDAETYSAAFSVVNYINKNGEPIITKTMDLASGGDEGVRNILHVKLVGTDTVDLAGTYVYQISIKDEGDNYDIPRQGILFIITNIHKDFID